MCVAMMEVLHSSKMSGLTRATQHNIPEDAILQIYFVFNFFANENWPVIKVPKYLNFSTFQNLLSYILLFFWHSREEM
jgi:hypothetical protein